jgi:hypothetical protein
VKGKPVSWTEAQIDELIEQVWRDFALSKRTDCFDEKRILHNEWQEQGRGSAKSN